MAKLELKQDQKMFLGQKSNFKYKTSGGQKGPLLTNSGAPNGLR